MIPIYLPRRLSFEDKPIAQEELLRLGRVILVLAEPGAGKTELLADLGRTLKVRPRSASRFSHQAATPSEAALIIDGLDEVARLDPRAIDPIIVKASESGAQSVILSSRSSEWDRARTRLLRECFEAEPSVVHLLPFDYDEQKAIFEAGLPGEDFTSFVEEADRFELRPLLGNPEFLQLFGEAYVQGGRRFASKRQIFVDAVTRLATERDDSPKQNGRAPIRSIVETGEEVFAKLLLSGSSGISLADDPGERDFPYLYALTSKDRALLKDALDTRLFKPSSEPGLHEPVHKIVAEYCAAQYLVSRIDDSGDRLSLRRVLALIAPNGIVRTELRGLLGWMAALGSREIQITCVSIDPYAVLANGDPSQLPPSSKQLLMRELRTLSEIDPYFRRSDSWRRFSVAGFFDEAMIDVLRGELMGEDAGEELRNLLLELLQGAEAVRHLAPELQGLLRDVAAPPSTRIRVQRLLLEVTDHDHRADFLALVAHGDRTSLRIAAETGGLLPTGKLAREDTLALLRSSADLSDEGRRREEQYVEHRYHVGTYIESLDLGETEWLLDELTRDLGCVCGAKHRHDCNCLQPVSRMVGKLLDRYFSLYAGPHEPGWLWAWIKPLRFRNQATTGKSVSVDLLQKNDALRQAIHRLAFAGRATANDVWKTRLQLSMSEGHSGLYFRKTDDAMLVNHAFETNNVVLWEGFYHRHDLWRSEKGQDELRALMRSQARGKPGLQRIWSRNERAVRLAVEKEGRGQRHRRYERREAKRKEATQAYFRDNTPRIVGGADWPALRLIADRYLIEPEKLGELFDDVTDAETALRNSFEFLKPHVPTLVSLADNRPYVVRVLHAACLAHFRDARDLDAIDTDVLTAVWTDLGGYQGYREGEAENFERAINARVFPTIDATEGFVRTYIEPQLSRAADAATDIGSFQHDEPFEPLRGKLAFQWLDRFPNMPWHARDTLFDICAAQTPRAQLDALIERRCEHFSHAPAVSDAETKARDFWFLRAIFFLENPPEEIWAWFRANRDSIFMFKERTGRFGRGDNEKWPSLSAGKIFQLMDMYVDAWPPVHLPSSYGTGDPPEEAAYRFLADIVWRIDKDTPERSIPVFDRILEDSRFSSLHASVLSQRASAVRKRALRNFLPPSSAAAVDLLDHNRLATVEELRALLIEELERLQKWVRNQETNPLKTFYNGATHADENTARDRIVDRLQERMSALNLSVVIERFMADQNRCDITVGVTLGGRQRLLVIEMKGQWHRELYTAAAEQLHKRYSSHPDAAEQGIYLVLWFGPDVPIAGRVDPSIANPAELRDSILARMPADMDGLIDVVVINLSAKPEQQVFWDRHRASDFLHQHQSLAC